MGCPIWPGICCWLTAGPCGLCCCCCCCCFCASLWNANMDMTTVHSHKSGFLSFSLFRFCQTRVKCHTCLINADINWGLLFRICNTCCCCWGDWGDFSVASSCCSACCGTAGRCCVVMPGFTPGFCGPIADIPGIPCPGICCGFPPVGICWFWYNCCGHLWSRFGRWSIPGSPIRFGMLACMFAAFICPCWAGGLICNWLICCCGCWGCWYTAWIWAACWACLAASTAAGFGAWAGLPPPADGLMACCGLMVLGGIVPTGWDGGWDIGCDVIVVDLIIVAIRRLSIWACCSRCCICCCRSFCLMFTQKGTGHLASRQCLACQQHSAISCLQIGQPPLFLRLQVFVWATTRFIFWQLGCRQLASRHWQECIKDWMQRWMDAFLESCGFCGLSPESEPPSRSKPSLSILCSWLSFW